MKQILVDGELKIVEYYMQCPKLGPNYTCTHKDRIRVTSYREGYPSCATTMSILCPLDDYDEVTTNV